MCFVHCITAVGRLVVHFLEAVCSDRIRYCRLVSSLLARGTHLISPGLHYLPGEGGVVPPAAGL